MGMIDFTYAYVGEGRSFLPCVGDKLLIRVEAPLGFNLNEEKRKPMVDKRRVDISTVDRVLLAKRET